MQIVILALVFLSVTGLALLAVLKINRREALKQRLNQLGITQGETQKPIADANKWQAKIVKVVGPMARLSAPKEGWEASLLRAQFIQAGLRESGWPVLFFSAKTLLALVLPGLLVSYQGFSSVALTRNILILLLLLAAIGYYLPNVLLSTRVRSRKRELTEALPDALDLMTVCVEAGLGLDAALNRAASEISLRSEALSEELGLVALELRMGMKRERALRNLALRSGVDDMSSFVAMLVQSDRFGTNVADALRVQAETMRTHRRLRAEETAAKIPLKLLFPLIFFIFPSLMLVLMGPAMLGIYRTLLPSLGGSR
ncbi:MAG: type II secretion system F family protein [Burkholderiales bacterium]